MLAPELLSISGDRISVPRSAGCPKDPYQRTEVALPSVVSNRSEECHSCRGHVRGF
jgi:hypothetical protein